MSTSSIRRRIVDNNALDNFSTDNGSMTVGVENATGDYIISGGTDFAHPYLKVDNRTGDVTITNNLMVLGNTSITNTSAVSLETTSIQVGLKNAIPITGIQQVSNTLYTNYQQYAVVSTDSDINFASTDGLKFNGIHYNNGTLDLTPYNKLYPYSSISKSFSFVNINPAVHGSTPNFAFTTNNNPLFDLTTTFLKNSKFSFTADAPFRVGSTLSANIGASDLSISVAETAGLPVIGDLLLRPNTAASTIVNAITASASNHTVVINGTTSGIVVGDYLSGVSATGSYHFVFGKVTALSVGASTTTLTMDGPISANVNVGSNVYRLEQVRYTNKNDTSFTLSARGSNASAITVESGTMQVFNKNAVSANDSFYFCDNPDSSLYTLTISTIINDTNKNYTPLFDINPIGLKMVAKEFAVWQFDSTCTSSKSFIAKDGTIGAIQSNTGIDNVFGMEFNFCDGASVDASKGIKLGNTWNDTLNFTKKVNDADVNVFSLDYSTNSLKFKNNANVQNNQNGLLQLNATDTTTSGNLHIGANKLNVEGSSGNLTSSGTMNISNTTDSSAVSNGSVVLSGGMGVAKSMNVGGVVHVTNTTASSTTYTEGAIVVDGGIGVAKKSMFGADVHIMGNSTLNGVSVINNDTDATSTNAGALKVGGGVTVTKNIKIGGNMNLTGAATIQDNLTANGATILLGGSSVTTGTTATINSATTAINSTAVNVAGATAISSTLGVTGATTLSNTLGVTGATTLGSTLSVTGASTLSGATTLGNNLSVAGSSSLSGATTLGSTLTVAGSSTLTGATSVGSGFTVAGASLLNSTLDVAGATTLNGATVIKNTLNIKSGTVDKFTVDNLTGNTDVQGTMAIKGDSTLHGGLFIQNSQNSNTFSVANGGETRFYNTTNSTSTTTGAVLVDGGMGVAKNIYSGANINAASGINAGADITAQGEVSSATLSVSGDSALHNTSVTGTFGATGATTLGSTLAVNSNTASTNTGTGAVTVVGGVGIGGAVNIGGTVEIAGATTVKNNLTIRNSGDSITQFSVDSTNGNTAITGTLTTTGQTTLNGGLSVTSGTVASSVDVSITSSTASTSSSTGALKVSGGMGVAGAVNVAGVTTVSNNLIIKDTTGTSTKLSVNTNGTTINDVFTVNNSTGNSQNFNIDGSGNMTVTGTSTLKSDVAVNNGTSNTFTVASSTGNTALSGTFNSNNVENILESGSGSNKTYSAPNTFQGGAIFKKDVRINGNASVIGSFAATETVATSDARLKENVVTLDNCIDKVNAMRGVYFDWINKEEFHDRRNVGFIAQEVEAAVPELVLTNNAGIKQVNYSQMSALLLQAIKEQQAIINGLVARLEKLEKSDVSQEEAIKSCVEEVAAATVAVEEVKPKKTKKAAAPKEPKEPKEPKKTKKAVKADGENVV